MKTHSQNYFKRLISLPFIIIIASWFGCYQDVDVRKIYCNQSDKVCPNGYGCLIASEDAATKNPIGICCKLGENGKLLCNLSDAGNKTPFTTWDGSGIHADATIDTRADSFRQDAAISTIFDGAALTDLGSDSFHLDQAIFSHDATTGVSDVSVPDVPLKTDTFVIPDGVSKPDVPVISPDGPIAPPPKLELGQLCKQNSECASENCVKGLCCDLACSGSCQACNQAATGKPDGHCGNLSNGTRCGDNQVCNAGTCGACVEMAPCTLPNPCKIGTTTCGSGSSVCTETGNAPQGTSCGPATSCTAGIKTLASQCNAIGQCVAGNVNCPNGCNAAGTDCDLDHCQPNPCLNLGTCKDGVGTFTCVCAKGWMGATCTIRIFEGVGFVSGFAKTSEVTAMSRDGNVVVGFSQGDTSIDRRGFKWSNGILSTLTTTNYNNTEAHGINSTGSVIVGSSYSDTHKTNIATVWQGTSMTTRIGAAGSYTSKAYGSNESGTIIIGDIQVGDYLTQVRWVSNGPYEEVSMGAGVTRSPEWIYVKAVSADASVVVGYCSDDPSGGYRWSAATGFQLLPNSNVAYGITADGSVAVGCSRVASMAAKWTGLQEPVSLGMTGCGYGVNANATVIVGRTSESKAFIWDATNGARILADVLTAVGADLSGWTLGEAIAISNDGKVIAGNGIHNGIPEGWVARLP